MIGRSQNKSLMQFPLSENEVRPGVANTSQDLSFIEVTTLILIKQGDQIWLLYPIMRDTLAAKRKITTVITTPGQTSFSYDEHYVIFLFSERPITIVLVFLDSRGSLTQVWFFLLKGLSTV